jgi:hypothetical protein
VTKKVVGVFVRSFSAARITSAGITGDPLELKMYLHYNGNLCVLTFHNTSFLLEF